MNTKWEFRLCSRSLQKDDVLICSWMLLLLLVIYIYKRLKSDSDSVHSSSCWSCTSMLKISAAKICHNFNISFCFLKLKYTFYRCICPAQYIQNCVLLLLQYQQNAVRLHLYLANPCDFTNGLFLALRVKIMQNSIHKKVRFTRQMYRE